MIQSIVNFVFLYSSRTNRENLAQNLRFPYSDGLGVKKNLFSYALQTTLALNTKTFYLYILGAAEKRRSNPQNGSVVLSCFLLYLLLRNSKLRAETRTNIWPCFLPAKRLGSSQNKFMVSCLWGKFVPESEPFLSERTCVCLLFQRKIIELFKF